MVLFEHFSYGFGSFNLKIHHLLGLIISRCADIVSSSLNNQCVLFVRLLKTCGFVLSVALLAVASNVLCCDFFHSQLFCHWKIIKGFFLPLLC